MGTPAARGRVSHEAPQESFITLWRCCAACCCQSQLGGASGTRIIIMLLLLFMIVIIIVIFTLLLLWRDPTPEIKESFPPSVWFSYL